MDDTVKKFIPNLRGLVDDRAEQILYGAFIRIYDYFGKALEDQKKTFEDKLKTQTQIISRQTELVNGFATQLIGLQNPPNPLAQLGGGTVTSITINAGTNLSGG